MKLQPRNGLVTVEIIDAKEAKTVHGLYLPPNQGAFFEMATVLEVGRGFADAGKHVGTDDLKPGMKVLIKSGVRQDVRAALSRFEFEVGQEKRKISLINQQDIVAIVDDGGVQPLTLAQ